MSHVEETDVMSHVEETDVMSHVEQSDIVVLVTDHSECDSTAGSGGGLFVTPELLARD